MGVPQINCIVDICLRNYYILICGKKTHLYLLKKYISILEFLVCLSVIPRHRASDPIHSAPPALHGTNPSVATMSICLTVRFLLQFPTPHYFHHDFPFQFGINLQDLIDFQ